MHTMKNSAVSAEWIKEAVTLNPIQHMGGGNFRTCPVRLSFPELFVAKPYKQQEPKFSVSILFPPFADLTELHAEMIKIGAAAFPESYSGGTLFGVPIPLRDQAERGNKAGYTPGLKFLNASASAERRPTVFDKPPAMTLVINPAKVYPGIWGIVSINLYASKSVKRVAAGLNAVTLYQDDTPLGGSAPDESQLRTHMAGIRMGTPLSVPSAHMGADVLDMSEEEAMRHLLG